MAQVTLRDLTTNDEFTVPPEGYIFGRVGGDADIQLEDNSISRRQARVSFKGGQWLLEVLAVPQGQRAPRPLALQPGGTFLVGQAEFEVLEVDAEGADDDMPDPAAKTFAPQKGKPGPAAVPPKKATSPAAKAASAPSPKRAATASAAAPAEEEAAGGGIKGLFVGVPKGIAYYLLNVPKLLLNPVGTVRKTIEELPTEPLGKTDLIGYAVPSLFFSLALGSIATGISALIAPGHAFLISAFLPIVPAISALIGAVVAGFVFHPVTEWIITKLQGTSDARSRSNYFLQMMTLGIILAVPQALGTVLGSIRFLNLLAPLLLLVGSMVSLYVAYQWVLKFELVKWTQLVVKILAVLAVLGAGFGFVGALISSVTGAGFGSVAVSAPSGDEGDTTAAAEELGEMPTDPEEAAEWSKKKQAQILAKAAEMQKKAMADAAAAQEKAADAQAQAENAGKDPKKDVPPEPKKADKKDEPKPEPKADPEPVAVKDTPPPPKEEPVVAAPVGASTGYTTFARKRDAIEKLFEADPTVLQKSAEFQRLYAAYAEEAWELDKKWAKETAKKPERTRLNARLKEAELYGKTSRTIDSLAAKLGVK